MGIQPNTQHTEVKMSETQKSGYEIRKELLHLAVGILSEKRRALMDNEHMKPDGSRNAVDPYTLEEVLTYANTLYDFVKTK